MIVENLSLLSRRFFFFTVQPAVKFLTKKNQPLALFCVSQIKEMMTRFSQAKNLFSVWLFNWRWPWARVRDDTFDSIS